MLVITVIDQERKKFRVYNTKKDYVEYPFESNVDINNDYYIRRYVMAKIVDLTRNKKKYDMYIIVTNSALADGFYNNFIEDNKLKSNTNILLTFRPFRKGHYLILE